MFQAKIQDKPNLVPLFISENASACQGNINS